MFVTKFLAMAIAIGLLSQTSLAASSELVKVEDLTLVEESLSPESSADALAHHGHGGHGGHHGGHGGHHGGHGGHHGGHGGHHGHHGHHHHHSGNSVDASATLPEPSVELSK